MATTAVFAEIIVIGLQVEAWLALYVAGLFDWQPTGLERWIALVTLVVVAAAYMFGVVLDRIADDAFGVLRKSKVFDRRQREPPSEFHKQRLVVLHAHGGLGAFIEYQRSRHRVARATALNGVISLPAIALVLGEAQAGAGVGAAVAIAMLLVITGSASGAIRIRHAYEDVLEEAFELVERQARAAR